MLTFAANSTFIRNEKWQAANVGGDIVIQSLSNLIVTRVVTLRLHDIPSYLKFRARQAFHGLMQ